MNLSRPASHRTCLRQTVIIMNGFHLKRYTNWPGPLNRHNLRGILHWVRQHRTAREEKLMGELSLPPYPLVEYKDALLWCTQSPRAKQTVSDSERVSHTLPLHICGVMWHPGGQERWTALVQLCDHDTILLIQSAALKVCV